MQNYNFSYDREFDDLFIYHPTLKSKGSVELGNFIFDYNAEKKIVGIQIAQASQTIQDMIENSDSISEILETLQECGLDIKTTNQILRINLFLKGKSKEINPSLTIPTITESSPSL